MQGIKPQQTATTSVEIDAGLRAHMTGVYNLMIVGMILTAATAYGLDRLVFSSVATGVTLGEGGAQLTALGNALYNTPLRWLLFMAPLLMVMVLAGGISSMRAGTARFVFLLYSVLTGASLSAIAHVYSDASVFQSFAITAAGFGALSLYGYTTNRDLTGVGSFCLMGLLGLIVASIVGLFTGSSAIQFAVNVLALGVFAGLTAYDTQAIKEMYDERDGVDEAGRKTVMGALNLYLNFLNIFMSVLNLSGDRD